MWQMRGQPHRRRQQQRRVLLLLQRQQGERSTEPGEDEVGGDERDEASADSVAPRRQREALRTCSVAFRPKRV